MGPGFTVSRTESDLTFQWDDIAGASDDVLLSGTDPPVALTNEVGAASSDAAGLTTPVPPDDVVCFLVAGRNTVCGTGPRN